LKTKIPLLISLILLQACNSNTIRQSSDLSGKWLHDTVSLYFADGTVHSEVNINCESDYSNQRLIVVCKHKDMTDRAVYIYRNIGQGQYEATLIENKRTPHLIGTKAITSYSIKTGYLYTVTRYPNPKAANPGLVIKIESSLFRKPG